MKEVLRVLLFQEMFQEAGRYSVRSFRFGPLKKLLQIFCFMPHNNNSSIKQALRELIQISFSEFLESFDDDLATYQIPFNCVIKGSRDHEPPYYSKEYTFRPHFEMQMSRFSHLGPSFNGWIFLQQKCMKSIYCSSKYINRV